MAYFPDLSPYAYSHHAQPGVVHVGWLDGVHEYPKGKVPEHLVAEMARLSMSPTELYRGFHVCELCRVPKNLKQAGDKAWWEWARPRASNGEIRVRRGEVTYAAPVLIVHYIEEHGYLPPQEYLQAIGEKSNKPDGANRSEPSLFRRWFAKLLPLAIFAPVAHLGRSA
jgi:hypothetical protein